MYGLLNVVFLFHIVKPFAPVTVFHVFQLYFEDTVGKVFFGMLGQIETTGQLNEVIRRAIPMKFQKTSGHPSKRTFQAIRIELNRELDVLRETLDDMIDMLNPGGRKPASFTSAAAFPKLSAISKISSSGIS